MKAMLLTAGLGERLFPLTLSLPKPAIPVLGRPLAIQILRWLGRSGVSGVTVNLHYLPDVMKKLIVSETGLPPIAVSFEETILGTAGALRKAADRLIGEGPILVSNADSLSDIDVRAMKRAHQASGHLATLALAPGRPGYSVVQADAHGRVVSLAGKPSVPPGRTTTRHVFTGCHIIEEELIDRIPPDRPSNIVTDVYQDLAAEGRLGAYVHEGFWWEFGSPALYLEGSLRLLDLSNRAGARITEHDPIRELDEAVAAIGPGARQHDEARFKRRAALGFASHVSKGSRLEDTVVMPEAWIGPDCHLERSIVASNVELPAGFEARDRLICLDPDGHAELPPLVERRDRLLIYPLAPSPS